VHRIGGNVSVLAVESDLDHDKIVNVLQIITDGLFGVFWTTVPDDQVPCSTDTNLVCNMGWQNELAIIPSNLNLQTLARCMDTENHGNAYPLAANVEIVALEMAIELLSMCFFEERHTGGFIMDSKIYI
jgi:hypothetical protein